MINLSRFFDSQVTVPRDDQVNKRLEPKETVMAPEAVKRILIARPVSF
jgi:hypothetical protein